MPLIELDPPTTLPCGTATDRPPSAAAGSVLNGHENLLL
jgi:hypothetical protein